MPHVVIEGNVNFENIWNSFSNTVERNKREIIVFEDAFLNHSKNLILIMTTVVNKNSSQIFHTDSKKRKSNTVRLDPLTDPKTKSELIMMSIAKMARLVMPINKDPDLSITKTKVNGYL